MQQLDRLARLDVVGQNKNTDLRMAGTDPLGGEKALVGVRRRHPDVGHYYVGYVPLDQRVELVSIPGLPRYGKAILGQDPRYPFPEQHGVIRQHHADHRGRSR